MDFFKETVKLTNFGENNKKFVSIVREFEYLSTVMNFEGKTVCNCCWSVIFKNWRQNCILGLLRPKNHLKIP